MIRTGLGKGLGALIESADSQNGGVIELGINEVEPNMGQPRKYFNDDKLLQLAESIKQHGIVQPLIVKKEGDLYKLVAGERRWRAARLAGLKTVPVVVKELTGKQVMEVALIENLQREDLNPIEEAEAYQKLIEDYEMTQEEIGGLVGRSRPAVANSLRLLSLQDQLKKKVINGELTSGHARALIPIENKEMQLAAAAEIIKKELNVRDTENLVKRLLEEKKKRQEPKISKNMQHIEDRLRETFGTKVKIQSGKNKGKILIEYYSMDELSRIVDIMFHVKH